MIYILETPIIDNFGNEISVYKFEYAKRRSAFLEEGPIYDVVKLLKGRGV